MSRAIRLLLAVVAVGTFAPAAHASCCDPVCKLYWERQPSVTANPDGSYTVDPGTRPQWVC